MSDLVSPDPAAIPDAGVPIIPGFDILRPLAQGGMGVIYLARRESDNRLVALKVIVDELLTCAEVVERFRREAQAAARLCHPNIVQLYEADQFADQLYLVMEYVDGSDLHGLVNQAGFLAVHQACRFAHQAALGLHHAHERGVVHRDIKPANLMITRTDAVVKILDMGLARMVHGDNNGRDARVTQEWDFVGTADYAAPEQAIDAGLADARSDVYSLGCTLYYLLTGVVPFPGGNTLEKLDRHRWDTAIPVCALRADVPVDVGRIIAQMMAKRPEERYQSAAEVADALLPFCPGGSGWAQVAMMSPPGPVQAAPSASDSLPIGEAGCWFGHEGPVTGVAFAPDARRVFSTGQDGTLRCWDISDGGELQNWRACRTSIHCLAITPNGRRVILAGGDQTLRHWGVEEGHRLEKWPLITGDIKSLCLSGNGRYVLLGTDDALIRMWDMATGEELRVFQGHTAAVLCVAFAPDSARILSGGEDHTLRLWDVASGREVQRAGEWATAYRKATVLSVAFSPHGRRGLSAGSDAAMLLWDMRTGKRLGRFEGHRGSIYAAIFVPNGRQLLSTGADKTVRLWDANSGKEIVCFTGHIDRVTCLACSASGRLAATGSVDGTVRLWRLPE